MMFKVQKLSFSQENYIVIRVISHIIIFITLYIFSAVPLFHSISLERFFYTEAYEYQNDNIICCISKK